MAYSYKTQPYVPPKALTEAEPRHRVAIVGAGPIGLAMAIDLALHGVPSVIFAQGNSVSVGSRAICWAKRTLEIFDRLGVGDRMLAKGITWKIGRLFHGKKEVYSFDLLPEEGHKMPAFINLQQYYVEDYLIDRIADFPDLIDLRWQNEVVSHTDKGDHVALQISTPDGTYEAEADYYLACDGARSPTRKRMGLRFTGETFEERFLIADVHMPQSPFGDGPAERWFWFKPPFHQGQSALLHKQPDDIYRIDLQLGFDADPDVEKQPDRVIPRIRQMVGDLPFELDWVSVYTFTCARLERFLHGRVIFVGDSAHIVSPFGARGGNGGIQDVDNLGWKLAAILQQRASEELLESYNEERTFGSDENIRNSARATNFMTPKTDMEHIFRDAVLDLAKTEPFARKLVNSGRLSTPCSLNGLNLQSSANDSLIGQACPDAPLGARSQSNWLLTEIARTDMNTFKLLLPYGWTCPSMSDVPDLPDIAVINIDEANLHYQNRFGPSAILLRPDQHVLARFTTQADLEAGLQFTVKTILDQ